MRNSGFMDDSFPSWVPQWDAKVFAGMVGFSNHDYAASRTSPYDVLPGNDLKTPLRVRGLRLGSVREHSAALLKTFPGHAGQLNTWSVIRWGNQRKLL